MHSTFYSDLERCIKTATLDDNTGQEKKLVGYSTASWQLERLRMTINSVMHAEGYRVFKVKVPQPEQEAQ